MNLDGDPKVCGAVDYEGLEEVTPETPLLVPELDADGEGDKEASLLRDVPFPSWVEQFCRQLLSARTGFSYFLVQSFKSCRHGRDDYIATALFPIPVPFPEVCGTGPKKPSQRCRQLNAMKKMVHCAVMALNYEHFRAPFAVVPLLRRKPSSGHAQVYARLMALLRACGPTRGVSVAGCGRKSFQLDARFGELRRCLDFLGLDSRSQYHSGFQSREVQVDDSRYEELRPYRELDAGRIKLSGRGQWQCEEFLSDLLYMPFMEPRINRWPVVPPAGAYPDVEQCNVEEVRKLCLLWDANNLLTLIPTTMGPSPEQKYLHSRVFGNFKRADVDRQIGDRRGANFVEGIIKGGPSQSLPTGPSLLQLEVPRLTKVICGSVTDRKDFYHQFAVTFERASTNTVFPSFAASSFAGTKAHEHFLEHFSRKKRKPNREEVGDFLGAPESLLVSPSDDPRVFACFAALFQGDHCGVDFACEAHGRLLEEAGCRDPQSTLVADEAVLHNDPATGLVIDDFFVVSIEDRDHCDGDRLLRPGKSSEVLDRAKRAYSEQGIQGSDEKEVRDQLLFKIAGAEINSLPDVVDRGLVSLGAPGEKRLGLAMVSAMLAGLPYTTDALHATLVGSWISALMFRRVLMAHVNELFQVVPARDLDTENPQLRKLPRRAAEELLILSTLSPFAASNIAAPFPEYVYASDASTAKGGFVRAHAGSELSKVLWRTSDRKGKSVPLPSKTAALHQIHDVSFEFGEEAFAVDAEDDTSEVERPIGLNFES
eukprot:s3554_g3.t1